MEYKLTKILINMRYEVYAAVKVYVSVCWVMTQFSLLGGYQRFGGS
jgi:hypothetical protein